MLEVFYAPTPNGWKVTILLEELVEAGVLDRSAFRVVPVNLAKGDQFKPSFLAICPNGKIPALVDGEIKVFESGAVLLYLAEKYNLFLGRDDAQKLETLQWLFWQVGGLGPMAGQVSHFINYAPHISPDADHSYSLTRYQREYERLLNVMDNQLAKHTYLSGEELTVADMASYPWVIPYKRFGADLSKHKHLERWFNELKERPAFRRGVDTLKDVNKFVGSKASDEAKKTLFQRSKM